MAKLVDFEVAVTRTLSTEGGYVNNPRDPGRETKYGISKRSYPNVDIANLTYDGAKVIYKRDFWDECASGLDDGVMFQVFDAAVNHGIGNAIRMLQRAVGVADDGHWGPHSQSTAAKYKEHQLIMLFLAQRLHFMRRLITFKDFGSGWSGRIADNLCYGAQDS